MWGEELSRMFSLLQQHSHTLDKAGSDPQERLPVLSLAIFGTYGSGKTSLLKTFIQEVNTGGVTEEFPGLQEKVYALPEIEPDNLSSDSHFLYAFLATALEEDLHPKRRRQKVITRRYRRADGEVRAYEDETVYEYWEDVEEIDSDSRILSPVQQAFQEASEYLQVIDASDRQRADYDPLGASLERLERHTSGLRLRKKLHRFIDALVDRLAGPDPSSLLLLPVDDPDLDRRSLLSTLETYRRYLMHPRLVPVFTFSDRLAEELLKVRYAQKMGFEGAASDADEVLEVESLTRMTRSLAFQYLVKLFPVRNRIRLGPAPARIQAAHYQVTPTQGPPVERKVRHLLEMSSLVLFGSADPQNDAIRYALRPSTLRRQVQVVDAMHEAGVGCFLDSRPSSANPLATHWVQIFKKSLWSLLNVHRDALLEMDLAIEDLYSWTRYSLRRVLLGTLLSLDAERRSRMLRRWRYRIESRRSQALSLLALEVFRPWVEGEEPESDDPQARRHYRQIEETRRRIARDNEERPEIEGLELPVADVVCWFLELWMGMYLPLILVEYAESRKLADRAKKRDSKEETTDRQRGHTRAVGWQLRTGPNRALEELLSAHRLVGPGMMLVDGRAMRDEFTEFLRKSEFRDEEEGRSGAPLVIIDAWCNYGHRNGFDWMALSLWRGLGLVGQLAKLGRRHAADLDGPRVRAAIRRLLSQHSVLARVPGYLGRSSTTFPGWKLSTVADWDQPLREGVEELVEAIVDWLQAEIPQTVSVMEGRSRSRGAGESGGEGAGQGDGASCPHLLWDAPLLGRLHGDGLIGELCHRLDIALARPMEGSDPSGIDRALPALRAWLDDLRRYLGGREAPEERAAAQSEEGVRRDEPQAQEADSREGREGSTRDRKPAPEARLWDFFATCPLVSPFLGAGAGSPWEEGVKELLGPVKRRPGDLGHWPPRGSAEPPRDLDGKPGRSEGEDADAEPGAEIVSP